ncbi:short transient receptor potential channel 4-like [Ptychodera flava]|uniref:short transient receptor potential channel 4-like n=1 Tax=Ptychodera flava TaxID=63121 RepID=UPI003969E0CF
MLAFPVLGLLYLIYPYGKFGRFMRTPYIKFLMHTASYVCFILLLFLSTTHFEHSEADHATGEDENLVDIKIKRRLSQQRGPPPSPVEYFIIMWVIGMTCREIRELWNSSLLEYITNAWNVMDLMQLGLYWAWIGLRLTAIILIYKERLRDREDVGKGCVSHGLCNVSISTELSDTFLDTIPEALENVVAPQNETTLLMLSQIHNHTIHHVENLLEGIATDLLHGVRELIDDMKSSPEYLAAYLNVTQKLTDMNELLSTLDAAALEATPTSLKVDVIRPDLADISYTKPRTEWSQLDPTLLAECVNAVANVISVVRFLRVMVINEYVGPLQISVGRMMNDIMKFMFIFALVWVAFALGLTQVYWSYAADGVYECMMSSETYKECYGKRFFPDVLVSMKTLFWSLYGLIDLEALGVEANHHSVEFFGALLFAGYEIIAVIILLNLLIALMGTTYDSIVQNADIEWKFFRSDMWMEYFRRGTTEAPPFNVLPGTTTIINSYKRLANCIQYRKTQKVQAMKSRSLKEKQEYYKNVCQLLVVRYFAEKSASSGESGDGGHTANSKVSTVVRFEMYDIVQRLEKTFEQFKSEVSGQLQELNSALEESKLAEMQAIEDIKDQLRKM